MSTKVESIEEILEALQYVNLVRIKFNTQHNWFACPLYEIKENIINVILETKYSKGIKTDGCVRIKFSSSRFEYIVLADICEVTDFNLIGISLDNFEAKKFINSRKYARYDTSLGVNMCTEDRETLDGVLKNLSLGGALITTEHQINKNSITQINIHLDKDIVIKTNIRIARESYDQEREEYNYGVEFVDVSKENYQILKKTVRKFEKTTFNSFNLLNDFENKDITTYNKRIIIFDYNDIEKVDIRESLAKMSAQNYEVIYDFTYYVDFFLSEEIDITIIDMEKLNDKNSNLIESINKNFPNITVIVVMPYEYLNEKIEFLKGIKVLYRPLVHNEFEDEIIKYL